MAGFYTFKYPLLMIYFHGLWNHTLLIHIYGFNLEPTAFLGGNVSIKAGHLGTFIYDKETEWDFPVMRYPHTIGNVPRHQQAGVFQG